MHSFNFRYSRLVRLTQPDENENVAEGQWPLRTSCTQLLLACSATDPVNESLALGTPRTGHSNARDPVATQLAQFCFDTNLQMFE